MSVSVGSIRAAKAFVELFVEDKKLVQGLRRAETYVLATGQKIQQIGRQMMTWGIAGAAPIAAAVKVFAGFDDQMRAVQATLNGTAKEYEMLTDKAKLLGRTTSFTAAQVAGSMLELARAGFQSGEIDDSIAGVLNLSRATGTDLAQSAEIAGNALRGFQLDASEMNRVSDVLVATANNGALNLIDLGESLKEVAPIARTAGMSLEETTKVIGALSNFGIKGTQAGNAMKRILVNMVDPKIKPIYDMIGVKTSENGKLRELSAVIRDVAAAVEGMPNAERLEIFAQLFDMRGLAAGASLTVASFDQLNNAIDNAAGTAQKQAEMMDAGIGGTIRMLLSAVEGLAISIGGTLAKNLQIAGSNIIDLVTRMTKWVDLNKTSVIWVAKMIAKLVALGAALVVTGTVLKSTAAILGAVRVAVTLLTGSMSALMAIPIVAVIGLIAAAAYSLYNACNQAAEATAKLRKETERLAEVREKGDETRKQDQLRVERLQQLAEKAKLTSDEMDEAERLTSELESRYGNFGGAVDTVAQKLTLAADAQERLNKAMSQVAVNELEAEIKANEKQYASLQKEQEGYLGKGSNTWRAIGDYFTTLEWEDGTEWGGLGLREAAQSRINELGDQMAEIAKKNSELRSRRDDILGGSVDAASGKEAPSTQSKIDEEENNRSVSLTARQDAEKRFAELSKKFSRERQTDLQNEIDDIKELSDEYRQLLETLLKGEKESRNPNQERIDQLQKELDNAKSVEDERIDRAIEKHAVKQDMEINADDIAVTNAEFDLSNAKMQYDLAKKMDDPQKMQQADLAIKQAQANLSGAEFAKAINDIRSARTEFEEASAHYNKMMDSGNDKELAAAVSRLQEAQKSLGAAGSYYDRIREGSKTAQDKASKTSNMGTFLAAAVRGLGTASVMDRVAEATESTARNTKKMANNPQQKMKFTT